MKKMSIVFRALRKAPDYCITFGQNRGQITLEATTITYTIRQLESTVGHSAITCDKPRYR